MTIPTYKDKQLRSLIQKEMKLKNRLIFTLLESEDKENGDNKSVDMKTIRKDLLEVLRGIIDHLSTNYSNNETAKIVIKQYQSQIDWAEKLIPENHV